MEGVLMEKVTRRSSEKVVSGGRRRISSEKLATGAFQGTSSEVVVREGRPEDNLRKS